MPANLLRAERSSGAPKSSAQSMIGSVANAADFDGNVTPQVRARVLGMLGDLKEYASNRKYGLSSRAPCLSDILANAYVMIELVFSSHDFATLSCNAYFNNFVVFFELLCQKCINLFREAGNEMSNPRSAYRATLLKLTLIFNHHNNELNAMFTCGQWQTWSCIQLSEPREFWQQNFSHMSAVPANDFLRVFKQKFSFTCQEELTAFKKSLDLCEDSMISWWEFDVFSRLFQPWDRLLNTWNVIVVKHPGYHAWSTYEQVKEALRPHLDKPGSYVFRLSVTRPGQWAIGFVHSNGRVLQAIPEGKSLYQALIDGSNDASYIYPNGQAQNIDVRSFMNVAADDHITVSHEQNAIYAKVDSKFETCKICHTNDKNYRIEPCGHLLCSACFDDWSKHQRGNAVCPFCRGQIRNSSTVVVQPFLQIVGADGGGGGESSTDTGRARASTLSADVGDGRSSGGAAAAGGATGGAAGGGADLGPAERPGGFTGARRGSLSDLEPRSWGRVSTSFEEFEASGRAGQRRHSHSAAKVEYKYNDSEEPIFSDMDTLRQVREAQAQIRREKEHEAREHGASLTDAAAFADRAVMAGSTFRGLPHPATLADLERESSAIRSGSGSGRLSEPVIRLPLNTSNRSSVRRQSAGDILGDPSEPARALVPGAEGARSGRRHSLHTIHSVSEIVHDPTAIPEMHNSSIVPEHQGRREAIRFQQLSEERPSHVSSEPAAGAGVESFQLQSYNDKKVQLRSDLSARLDNLWQDLGERSVSRQAHAGNDGNGDGGQAAEEGQLPRLGAEDPPAHAAAGAGPMRLPEAKRRSAPIPRSMAAADSAHLSSDDENDLEDMVDFDAVRGARPLRFYSERITQNERAPHVIRGTDLRRERPLPSTPVLGSDGGEAMGASAVPAVDYASDDDSSNELDLALGYLNSFIFSMDSQSHEHYEALANAANAAESISRQTARMQAALASMEERVGLCLVEGGGEDGGDARMPSVQTSATDGDCLEEWSSAGRNLDTPGAPGTREYFLNAQGLAGGAAEQAQDAPAARGTPPLRTAESNAFEEWSLGGRRTDAPGAPGTHEGFVSVVEHDRGLSVSVRLHGQQNMEPLDGHGLAGGAEQARNQPTSRAASSVGRAAVQPAAAGLVLESPERAAAVALLHPEWRTDLERTTEHAGSLGEPRVRQNGPGVRQLAKCSP